MNEIPEVVQSWIGKRRHEEVGEFDVERGFVLTGCSSVENGNPLYWSEDTANEITGGLRWSNAASAEVRAYGLAPLVLESGSWRP